jgi:hypothetical protein
MMVASIVPASAEYTPNDPDWPIGDEGYNDEQYQHGPQQIQTEFAWDPENEGELTNPGSSNIVVALIDSGVMYDSTNGFHEDLGGVSLWKNQEELDGITNYDDDGNNIDDDIYGYDWIDDDVTPWTKNKGSSADDNEWAGHGTHDAGILAATIDNLKGIAGMAQIEIMCLRVAGPDKDDGISMQDCIDAVDYAIDQGADIISFPITFNDDQEDRLDDLIAEARNKGILWIASAGKHPNNPGYPARMDAVVGVGASSPDWFDDDHHRAQTSPTGQDLDLIAPGGYGDGVGDTNNRIWSTWFAYQNPSQVNKYYGKSGTSAAAQHTAGLAALMMSSRPSFTPGRLFQILNATCLDITDVDPFSLKYDEDASRGKDIYTGWGEINASLTFGYTDHLRNRWSDGTSVQTSGIPIFEDKQPAIATDSYGWSHIVWIEKVSNVDCVKYTKVDPAGRMGAVKNPELNILQGDTDTTATWSAFPDVFVDKDDRAHVTWLEYNITSGTGDEIWYRKYEPDMSENKNEFVTATGTEKRFVNVVAYENGDPAVVYTKLNGAPGNDWDIYWTKKTNGVWANPIWLTKDFGGIYRNQIKPSADIMRTSTKEVVAVAYMKQKTDQSDDWEIELCLWDAVGAQSTYYFLTSDNVANKNPNLCTVHQEDLVYVVWQSIDKGDMNRDVIEVSAIHVDGTNANTITYGKSSMSSSGRQVGEPSVSGQQGAVEKKYPKVGAGYVGKVYRGSSADDRIIQVDVIWQEKNGQDWAVFYGELTMDGRCLTEDEQGVLFDDCSGIPQITATQYRSNSRGTTWLNKDGNFRMLYYFSYGGQQNQLWYASTNERWTSVGTQYDANHPLTSTHMDIDDKNGLHVVFHDTNKEIIYEYWANSRPGPSTIPTYSATISPDGNECGEPRVTTYTTGNFVYAYVIYLNDYGTVDQELWFSRVMHNGLLHTILDRERLDCTSSTFEYPASQHEIANDYEHQRIGVVWTEFDEGGDNSDIHFGVIDYDNNYLKDETDAVVDGTTDNDIHPDIDVDTVGDYHIVYQADYDIYYNAVDSSDSYSKMNDDDIQVDDQETTLDSSYPTIRIDRDIYRRDENTRDHDALGRTNRFLHISYCRKSSSLTRYTVWYTKMANSNDIVVEEKVINGMTSWGNNFASSEVILPKIALNRENQVALVFRANMQYPSTAHEASGIWFIKVDNNGAVETQEMRISQGLEPTPEYDHGAYESLSVVWKYHDGTGWGYAYSEENYSTL